jgi:hypothetical protein
VFKLAMTADAPPPCIKIAAAFDALEPHNVSISVLQIIFGRTNALLSPRLLIPWAISFVLTCVQDVSHTSSRPIPMERLFLLGRRLIGDFDW